MKHSTSQRIENLNVIAHELLPTPRSVKSELSVSTETARNVAAARKVVADVIKRRDHRLLVVLGPCSIHDVDAGTEYATKLKALASRVEHSLVLVMRAYFEKPRTTVGWKGLINDPFLDDSFQIEHGIRLARKFLLDVAHTGLPLSTEALDPITPQYLQDLVSWSAIGARTTESQTHREMASGLSVSHWLQERDRRRDADGNQCTEVSHDPPSIPWHQSVRAGICHPYRRQ